MAFIESILNEIDPQLVEGIAREAGVDKIQVERAAKGAVPVLLNAFSKGLRSSAGESFLSLLELGRGQGVFDDLMDSLQSKHAISGIFPLIEGLLGKKTLQKLCAASGLSQDQVAHLLQALFPAVLRVLGRGESTDVASAAYLAQRVEKERDVAAEESPEGSLVLSYMMEGESEGHSDDIFAFGAQMMVSLLGARRQAG